MATTAENVIVAGSETRPPMLEKGMYNKITIKDTNGITDILRPQRLEDLEGQDKLRYDSDIKAVNILLLGLPVDIYTLINHYQKAKELWDRVKELMEGTKTTKQERESMLHNKFDKFTFEPGESIHSYYMRSIGHMAKQCTTRKRVKDSEWLKEKMLLTKAQEPGVVLNDEQRDFLVDSLEETDDYCDDEVTTNVIFMANLSPVGSLNDDTIEPHYDSDMISKKLNDATRKDHFPLPFIDQMLERLSGNEYYCFLDGFSGYFQIPLAPEDQRKTTFTCPYGTFAYRRMPFGLCNAPATFQRCMTSNFHDMCKDFMEVFMDDFSVFGNSFNSCLNNLSKMLARCEETNLVLNWEKCHFMVKEGIFLGHKISKAKIEVDKAKVDVITKLPYPTNIKGIRSFLGHAGFYRRFIKDFSKITRPMTQLLTKDTKFVFSNECIKSFDILRSKLTTASVIFAPSWNLDFELICDASDYAEFTIEIKDKKGSENLVADHLSRLENPKLEELDEDAIRYLFPDEYLMVINIKEAKTDPWYADYANFLVSKIVPQHLTYHLRKKFHTDVKKYIWDDPYLFKSCPDGIIRRCIFGKELHEILKHCHTGPTRGHYGADTTARKVFEAGFYWPTIFKDSAMTINGNRKEWADKLDDALWAFRTAYKAPIGSTPFRIVYGKACHMPLEMEHKAYWEFLILILLFLFISFP
ncbi:reverse transcriptase domain-containing protein [Tanacetum coccineum]